MAVLTSPEEIKALRKSGQIAAQALQDAITAAKPGMTTAELDAIAHEGITKRGGMPSFIGYEGYNHATCISVNNEVVHGIPSADRVIQEGDVVGLDIGVIYDGLFTDHAITIGIGNIEAKDQALIEDTKQSLMEGLKKARVGAHIGDLSATIQKYLEQRKYGVVRQLVGHGVGKAVHESPSVPNFGQAGTGPLFTEGLVIAVEPMVTLGDWQVETKEDGWTVVTIDGTRAAHFEHTVLVTSKGVEIITVP